jgi:hypothetical protein
VGTFYVKKSSNKVFEPVLQVERTRLNGLP